MAHQIASQISAERVARGLSPLTYDNNLANLAQWYANGQASGAYPSGDAYYDYAQHTQYLWFSNVSAASGNTEPSSLYTLLFMDSPPHRDDLLQKAPNQTIGVGLACSANGTTWVQVNTGSVTANDPSYTTGSPSGPVVTPEYSGTACSSPLTPTQVKSGPLTSGIASTPTGNGYWVTDTRGNVTGYGGAPSLGGLGGVNLNAPIEHIVATPTGRGYWLVASDGGIFSFGDARFLGSMGGQHINAPVVDMAPTPSGNGYWLVASDGGIFSFGDATFHGSTGAIHLNQPVVDMAPTPSGKGYWLVATDGGIFAFGDATFHGSTGGDVLTRPVVTMAATPDGGGYWLVGADGGVFTFGDAPFAGSVSGQSSTPIVGIAVDAITDGYWLINSGGTVYNLGTPAPIWPH